MEFKIPAITSPSTKGLLQSDALPDYILETTVYPRESKHLKELREVTASHPWSGMSTAPDAAQLMAMLLKLINAKKTIEVGVFTGYSLLLTALTIPHDGNIIAVDVDQKAYEMGLPIIKKAGVEHKINFINSMALPVLDKLLMDGSFDFAYVDADKTNYINYHDRLMKLVKVGGMIVYDNTLWRGSVAMPEEVAMKDDIIRPMWKGILEFNKAVESDPRVRISQVPVGDGSTICVRLQ